MDIQLIILDMDGTLYDLKDIHSMNYKLQVEFLAHEKNITLADAENVLNNNDIFPVISERSKSATEYFARSGIDMEKWRLFREKNFDVNLIDSNNTIHEQTLEKLNETAPLVLLSSNSMSNIKIVLRHLEIRTNIFKAIYCSDNILTDEPFNKKKAIQLIAQKHKTAFWNILSIGDRYQTDILPMLELGGHGIVICCPQALNNVCIDIKNGSLKSNESYQLFQTT